LKWRSSTLPAPKTSSSVISSGSILVVASGPRALGRREKATLNGAVKMCRCLEYMTSTRNPSTTARWASRKPSLSSRRVSGARPSSSRPTAVEAKAQPS
jgi:hypothetical protein